MTIEEAYRYLTEHPRDDVWVQIVPKDAQYAQYVVGERKFPFVHGVVNQDIMINFVTEEDVIKLAMEAKQRAIDAELDEINSSIDAH